MFVVCLTYIQGFAVCSCRSADGVGAGLHHLCDFRCAVVRPNKRRIHSQRKAKFPIVQRCPDYAVSIQHWRELECNDAWRYAVSAKGFIVVFSFFFIAVCRFSSCVGCFHPHTPESPQPNKTNNTFWFVFGGVVLCFVLCVVLCEIVHAACGLWRRAIGACVFPVIRHHHHFPRDECVCGHSAQDVSRWIHVRSLFSVLS